MDAEETIYAWVCPLCNRPVRVAGEFLGRNAECKFCKGISRVPAALPRHIEPAQKMGILDPPTGRDSETLEAFLRRMLRDMGKQDPYSTIPGYFDCLALFSLDQLVGSVPATIMTITEQYDELCSQGFPSTDAIERINSHRQAILVATGTLDSIEECSVPTSLEDFIEQVINREHPDTGGFSIDRDFVTHVVGEARNFARKNPKNTMLALQANHSSDAFIMPKMIAGAYWLYLWALGIFRKRWNRFYTGVFINSCKSGDETQVHKMLEEKPELAYIRDKKGISALFYAVANGDSGIVDALLRITRQPDDVEPKKGLTPLNIAATNGRIALVSLLLKYGANPNLRNFDGVTALHNAVFEKEIETVRLLIENGADPTIRDRLGNTPLDLALRSGDSQLIQLCSGSAPLDPEDLE